MPAPSYAGAMAIATFPITGDAAADQLLVDDPLALLIGMLLDQQVPMEWAFRGPATLSARLGGLDAARIAAMEPEALVEVFREKPALHRYPGSMAKRTHALCQVIVDSYDGDATKIWRGVEDPEVLLERLHALPGYGEEKAKIFLALLGKRFGLAPVGLGEVRPAVLRRAAPVRGRRRFRRVPRTGAAVEAGAEGEGPRQSRPLTSSVFLRHPYAPTTVFFVEAQRLSRVRRRPSRGAKP